MYQISDHPCPLCFRLLRVKPNESGFYCPDQINCGWKTDQIKKQGSRRTFLPLSYLQEELEKARNGDDHIKMQRINIVLSRR